MIKTIRFILFFAVCALCVGCATQKNVALSEDFWQEKKSVVIVTAVPSEPEMHQLGLQGLLDYGLNSFFNRKIDAHLKNTDIAWYKDLSQDFVNDFEKYGIEGKKYPKRYEAPYPDNSAKKYIDFAREMHSDTLLFLRLETVGAKRYYYSFIPLSAPKAICTLSGELVDAGSGDVLWRYTSKIEQDIPKKWSEPPDYPHLSQALESSMDAAREEVLSNFFETAR